MTRVAAAFGSLFCLFATGCGKPGAAASASPPKAVSVSVAKATQTDMSRSIVLTAEFIPYQEIEVMAKVAGFVKTISVDVGDHVREGQILAELEVPEMRDEQAKARAATARAQAEVSRAKDEIQRAESAHQMLHLNFSRLSDVNRQRPGLVAQQEIDDAQSKDLVSESQIGAAKSNLDAALEALNGAKLEETRLATLYDYTRVTAPFAGIITRRFANTGSMIQAGTASQTQAMPVVRLSENSLLRLILPVPESAVPTVRTGQKVDVDVSTLHQKFPGRVARFNERVSTATRTMDTEVDVPNPSLVLIPGMYADVNLTTLSTGRVIAIPLGAFDRESETSGHVTVVSPEHRIEIRKVTPGTESADLVEIRSGLREGEAVVTSNRTGLEAGEIVRASNQPSNQ